MGPPIPENQRCAMHPNSPHTASQCLVLGAVTAQVANITEAALTTNRHGGFRGGFGDARDFRRGPYSRPPQRDPRGNPRAPANGPTGPRPRPAPAPPAPSMAEEPARAEAPAELEEDYDMETLVDEEEWADQVNRVSVDSESQPRDLLTLLPSKSDERR